MMGKETVLGPHVLGEPRGDVIVSNIGKYCGAVFELANRRERFLALSVHLPHKTGRAKAYNALLKAVEDYSPDCDGVIVYGDFNMEPGQIAAEFKDFKVALDRTHDATTDKNRRKDNCIYQGSLAATSVKVWRDEDAFSHRPISADMKVER
eukprot:CAMPEP_0184656150 /NCGR_PEP_ID=MMETSP0308-20130426/15793_1 /TAXON_ID=38269 /ORGANISM="Gloeochaete witrockiana, Strain SAG 46.84" /LENGTH=150 /DNA_ID=CAMNT_0027093125 /DNA_START=310 /DNA_END=762 /DNA_ORIENTATION=+